MKLTIIFKITATAFLIFIGSDVNAQNHLLLDSLLQVLPNSKGENRVKNLLKLHTITRDEAYLENARAEAESSNYYDGVVEYYIRKASAYQVKNRFSESLKYLLIAKNYVDEYKCDPFLTLLTYSRVASILFDLGNITSGEEYFNKSISLLSTVKINREHAYLFNNFLGILSAKGDLHKAKSFFYHYLETMKKTGETIAMTNYYILGAKLFLDGVCLDSVPVLLNEAYQILNKYPDKYINVWCFYYHTNYEYQLAKKNLDSAYLYLDLCLKKSENGNFSDLYKWQAIANRDFSKFYEMRGEKEKSYFHAKKYYEISKAHGFRNDLKQALDILSKISIENKRYKDALEFYKLQLAISDSINTELKYISSVNAFLENQLYTTTRNNTKLQEKHLETKSKLQQKQAMELGLLISLSIVLTLSAIVFYFALKYRITNRLLKAQANEIIRKNELLQEQFIMLEDLNKERTALLGVVSHDLRAPIHRIQGLLTLLQLSQSEEEKTRYYDLIHKEIEDSKSLINKILESENNQNKEALTYAEVNLKTLLEEKIPLYKLSSDKKSIQLEMHVIGERFLTLTHKPYLERILDNLVSNAIKFSYKQSVIQLVLIEKNTTLELSVKDEGQGMTEEDLKQLFKKYAKLSSIPTDGEKSIGLGMHIVKQLVEEIGAKIEVKSEKGKGTIFTVIFKQAEPNEPS